MSKNKQAIVPKEWWETKKKMAQKLGISTPEAIKLTDGIFAELVKRKGKRGKKFEVSLK